MALSSNVISGNAETKYSPSFVMESLYGVGLILVSGVCISLLEASKHLLTDVPTGRYTTYASICCILFTVPVVVFKGTSLYKFERKNMVYLKALVASLATLARTWSIKNMKFGEAMSIIWTAPFFAIVMARVFLGHKVNRIQQFCCVLAAVGIVLVSKPEFIFPTSSHHLGKHYSPYGPIVAGIGAVGSGAAITAQKAMDTSVEPIVSVFYVEVGMVVSGAIYSVAASEPVQLLGCYLDRAGVLVGGFFSLFGMWLFNMGIARESAATAGLVKNFDLVFCYAIQVFFFKEPAEVLSVCGTGFILASVLLAAFSIFYYDKQEQKETEKLIE